MNAPDRYASVRSAVVPMLLTGLLVGTGASEDPSWGLLGMAVGLGVWLGWVVVHIVVNAWSAYRKERR